MSELPNPFDDLDEVDGGGGQTLRAAPEPDLAERFLLNFEAGQRYNTVLGALKDTTRQDDRARFDDKFEAFPEWEGTLEGITALGGQLAGTAAALENFVPVGLGAKAVAGFTGMSMATIRARIFSGAIDAAIVNAGTDAGIQGIELAGGNRQAFDPYQLAGSVALGTVAGGVAGPLTRGIGKEAMLAREIERGANALDDLPARLSFDNARRAALEAPEVANAPKAQDLVSGDQVEAEPKALGDRLAEEVGIQPAPEDDLAAMASPPDDSNAPDINGEGPFGPILETGRYADDWLGLVSRLKELKTGEAPDALHHPDIGGIDIVYGEYDPAAGVGYGLSKILSKHPEVIDDLPKIISESEIVSRSNSRIILMAGDKRSVVNLNFKESEKTWLLTTYTKRLEGQPKGVKKGGAFEVGSGARTVANRTQQSSGSPPNGNIVDGARFDNREDVSGQRVEGSTERPDNHQTDTSSVSPTSENINENIDPENLGDDFFARMTGGRGQPTRATKGTGQESASTEFVRLRDISNRLADLVGAGATRQGRFSVKAQKGFKVQGQYSRRSAVVRVRSQDDFDTFTHEIGHHVDEKFNADLKPLFQIHASELADMAYPGAAEKVKVSEGFAEYFRLFMTNPVYAGQHAPKFDRAFRAYLKEMQPDLLTDLDEIQTAYRAWLQQPSDQAVTSTIVSARRRGMVEDTRETMRRHGVGATIADFLHSAYGAMFDTLHPIQRAVRGLAEIHKANTGKTLNLKASDDAYKIARMSRGAQNAGHMDIVYGVHAYRGTRPASASLRDALVEALGRPNALSKWDDARAQAFGAYLWSRRAIGEWDRFEAGKIANRPDKLTKGDHATNISEMESRYPAFASAAAKVHEWTRALWAKKRDAGLITDEQYTAGLEIRDYVPGLRSFDYDGDAPKKGGKRGQSAKAGFTKRFRGSSRDVINPLESLMADAYETSMAIARNDVVKQLDRLARLAGNGSGAIAERIPAKQIMGQMVDPLEAVSAAARQAGLQEPDILVLRDSLEGLIGDDKAAIFRPAIINENGETIAFYRDAGELKALRLADGKFGRDMFQALTGMTAPERNMFIQMLALPASVLRAGITTAAEFILANLIRDQAMASIFYGKPFQRLGRTLKGGADEILSRDAARAYNQAGGIMGGQETSALRDLSVNRDLQALRRKGWIAQRATSFRGIMQVAEISETGMRIGLFKSFFEEAKARGLDEFEATFEAAWRARDHLDFDRRGWAMSGLSRIIPFLNASLQGFDKTSRVLIAPLAKRMLGETLTAEDERAMGQAVKAWARLAALTVSGLTLHAIMSRQEDYEEISDTTRATHWMVKAYDKWVAVPKPFELAVVTNAAEAAFDAWAKNDPLAAERYMESALQVLAPPSVAEGNPLIKTYFELKANQDFFTGREIVPERLQAVEPWLQYTTSTSALSKQLGEATGMSPLIMDKLITNFTATWGRSALAMYDWTDENKPGQSIDDAPFLRRFVKDASKGARSSRKFWDLVSPSTGAFEGAAKTYRALMDDIDPAAAQDFLGTLETNERAFVTISMMDAKTRRLHPLLRTRSAIRAIGQLRRGLAENRVDAADGEIPPIASGDRGVADDILADLAMAEARNALITLGVPGWAHLKPIATDTYVRELQAVSGDLFNALADRYATAKVLPAEVVTKFWPELKTRALQEGTDAITDDLAAEAEALGFELDGIRIKRKPKPAVPGLAVNG